MLAPNSKLAYAVKEPFHGIKPAIGTRTVLVAAFFHRRVKLFQQILLLGRQVNGCLNGHLRKQITLAMISRS